MSRYRYKRLEDGSWKGPSGLVYPSATTEEFRDGWEDVAVHIRAARRRERLPVILALTAAAISVTSVLLRILAG